MTGSRGFVCVGGPVAGNVVMLAETAESGSLWNVEDATGTSHRYRFTGSRFEHSPTGAPPEDSAL